MSSLLGLTCAASDGATIVDIDAYKIKEAPPTVYYIPDFITKEEEQQLLDKVYKVPKPKWTQLSNRRLQNWGGIPHAKGMLVEVIPQWLSTYLDKVWQLGVFEKSCKPNHVLINEYLAGQGIMPHFDGPLFYPTITTLSLGSHAVLDCYTPKSEEEDSSCGSKMLKSHSLLVESRSLLILQDEMYCKYLHGIEDRRVDTLISSDILNWHACEVSRSELQDEISSEKEENEIFDLRDHSSSVEEKCCQDQGKRMSEFRGNLDDTGEESVSTSDNHDSKLMSHGEDANHASRGEGGLGPKTLSRGTRISLTMRHVPKTSKVKIKLGR